MLFSIDKYGKKGKGILILMGSGLFICITCLVMFGFFSKMRKRPSTNHNSMQVVKEQNKDRHFKDKDISKYAAGIRELKKEIKAPVEKKITGLKLNINGNNAELLLDKASFENNGDYEKVKNTIEKLSKLKEIDNENLFISESEKVKSEISDAKVNAYLAIVAEQKEFLETSYNNIKTAVTKDAGNKLYNELFKKIYNERANRIANKRQSTIKK